jgi:integrase/recombinase XerD
MSKRKAAPPGCFWRGDILWGRIQVRGRDIKWSLRTNDPAAARRRRKEYQEQAVARAYYGEQRRTFAEVLEAWGKVITREVAPRTAARYAVSLGQLQPFLDGLYLDQVDGARVAEIIRLRQAHKITNATIKRDLVALSSVINFAIGQAWTEANPVPSRMRLLKERRDPIMLPEHSHIRMVIDRAPGMFANLVEIACKTGARQEELVNARREQFDHVRRTLSLIGKGNKRRTIDLDPFDGYDALRSLPTALGGAFLFWHHQGQRYRNVASRFRALVADVAERAKKQGKEFRPFRFHDLRHRHAVDWLQSGRSIYDLQQRLGHKSVKTTEIYLEFLTAEEARTVKQQAGTKTGPSA